MLYMHVPHAVRLRLQLLLPLQQQRRRHDDQHRLAPAVVLVLVRRLVHDHSCDHLHGLPEAHVVCEDAAFMGGVALLVDHPAHADELVREQADFHPREVVVHTAEGEACQRGC